MIDPHDRPLTVAELLDRIERGKIGTQAAMDWLGIESYVELVDIVHFNRRKMWAHRATKPPAATVALLKSLPLRAKQPQEPSSKRNGEHQQ
jgi:hypothetical protein